MRVLYVDDDYMLLRTVQRSLARKGHEVRTIHAVDADMLLRTVQRNLARFDVALIDWDPMGPVMVDICERLGVPFVIYTGDVGGSVKEYILEADRVLAKPAKADEIVRQLELAIDDREASNG